MEKNECEQIYEVVLSNDDAKFLIKLSEKITASPSQNPELFCKQSKQIAELVPEKIKKILKNFSKHGSCTCYLIFKNIPITRNNEELIPHTPPDNSFKIGEKTVLAKIQSIFIHVMGDTISYEAECDGNLFQDIVPCKKMQSQQTSLSSGVELEVHTEQAFSKFKPDIISLGCIRGNEMAETYIYPVKKFLNVLSKDEIILLKQPLWKVGVDMSFKLNGHEFLDGNIRGPISIIHGSEQDPHFIFDQDLMKGITKSSHKIIKKMVDIYRDERNKHVLMPGEIIFVDNLRAIHGRSFFTPKYDVKDRFLIRSFGTFNFEKSIYARQGSGHMVYAKYS